MEASADKLEFACTIQAVREVRIEVDHDRLADIERFYCGIFALKPWPANWQTPGGWGVGPPLRGLRFEWRHPPNIDPLRRRLTLLVNSLDLLAVRLEEAEWAFSRARGLLLTDDVIELLDPVGHLVHVRQSQLI